MKGFSLIIAFLLAAVAVAETFDYHCADFAIMQDKRVQAEIGISESQRQQMNKFAETNRQRLLAYQKRRAGKPLERSVLDGYLADLKRNIVSIMSPTQVKRLRELNLQAAGLLGLMDKVVATKVGMSDSQYKRFSQTYMSGKSQADSIVRATIMPINQKYQKLALPYKGHEREHQAELKKLNEQYAEEAKAAQQRIQPRINAITQDTQQKLLAMLTPQEKASWGSLKGRLFNPPNK